MLVTVKRQSPDDTEAVPVKHRVWTVCTTSPPLPSAVSATGYILLQHRAFSCTTAASGPSERDGKRKWASLWRLILNSSPLSNTYSRFQWGSRRCVVAPSIHRKTSFKQLCFCAIDTEDVIDQVTPSWLALSLVPPILALCSNNSQIQIVIGSNWSTVLHHNSSNISINQHLI